MGNNKRKELRASRLDAGLCMYCGDQPTKSGCKGCHTCLSKNYNVHKRYLQTNPNKQREYRKEVRWSVIDKYGGECSCCHESRKEFLTIDHANGDGHSERRELYGKKEGSSHRWFLKLKRENLRDDLRVLCYNCNNAIAIFGKCPHENETSNS